MPGYVAPPPVDGVRRSARDVFRRVILACVLLAGGPATFACGMHGDGDEAPVSDAGVSSNGGRDASVFSTTPLVWTANVVGNGHACYDFDDAADVDCGSGADAWDLMFEVAGTEWRLWTNGGVHGSGDGAAFGPMTPEEAAAMKSSKDIPGMFADYTGGIFASAPWYAYGVLGTHDISPNYRVYVVDTGAGKYRVQVLSYYSAAGESGRVTLRYGALGEESWEEIELDARAGGFGATKDDPANRHAYFDLDTGAVLDLDDVTARAANTAWDLGFNRYGVLVNGGDAGPGEARAALAVAQTALYDEAGDPIKAAFEAVTPADALQAFESVTNSAGLSFVEDEGHPYIIKDGSEKGWFGFEFSGGGPRFFPRPEVWWAVRSSTRDSFAKLHVVGVDTSKREWRIELFVQPRSAP